jgi:hypothetical protein
VSLAITILAKRDRGSRKGKVLKSEFGQKEMDAIVICRGYRHRRCVALALRLHFGGRRNVKDKTLVSRRFTSKYVVLECSVGPT